MMLALPFISLYTSTHPPVHTDINFLISYFIIFLGFLENSFKILLGETCTAETSNS
jgi:hypothetical protein